MYSRNYSSRRFSPPPGYVGSAFSDVKTKHHLPPEEVETPEETPVAAIEPVQAARVDHSHNTEGKNALEELIRSLRGKIGSEEMLILLVMLLTASDGIGVETMILAFALLAGRGRGER